MDGTGLLIWIALLVVGLWFIVIRPQRRLRARALEVQSALGPGDEVVTLGGLYGRITALDDDVAHLEVAPGVEIRVARRALASRVPEAGGDESAEPDELDEVDADEALDEDARRA